MRRQLISVLSTTALGLGLLAQAGCDDGQANVLSGVSSIVYIQRTVQSTGNVFDYTSDGSDANIFTLTPPTASGVKKNLTNWKGAEIISADLSFDARELTFSARAPGGDRFHVYRINLDGTNPCDAKAGKVSQGACQITDGPFDQTYPVYMPGGRLFFVTNQNVEGTEVPQFRDEYERATTAQVANATVDGGDIVLGPRNVSHRVSPTMLQDGRVLMTEWRHLGETNEGDLTILNQDLTGAREGFGREGKGITNNYLRAKEVSPGVVVAIGTARDRTFQAGKLVLVNLGGSDINSQSEARSSVQDLTPNVPGDRSPSFVGVGRYYDVSPLAGKADQYLVSWADGTVEQETLAQAKASPDFGIYVFNAKTGERFPVVNEVGTWEVNAIAVTPRTEPAALKQAFLAQGTNSTLLAAINVTDSSLFPGIPNGAVKKVRVSEGFSAEEGFPNDFGLTEFDGIARLGDVDVNADGSFKAIVPANTPVRFQLLDKYGMSLMQNGGQTSEPLWIQGRAGEARVCGGCHEDRTKPIQLTPGSSLLQAINAAPLDYAGKMRQERKTTDFSYAKVMGVPWTTALQPIYDAKCASCHDGSKGAANPSYSLMDLTDMVQFDWTFDLTGREVKLAFGEMQYTYSASHISMLGPSMALREKAFTVTSGVLKEYITPGSAAQSDAIKMINPPARFPALDLNDRAFGAAPQHPKGVSYNGIDGNDPKFELTADEYYLMILSADSGAQYYSRENRPGGY